MLRQICRRGRLMSLLRNPIIGSKTSRNPLIAEPEEKEDPSGLGLKAVPLNVYEEILYYINQQTRSNEVRHYKSLPHPENATVLPRYAIPIKRFRHKCRDYSIFDDHPGNSAIHFEPQMDGINSGHIESAWSFKQSDGNCRTYIIVSKHQPLSLKDEERSPYHLRPGFLAKIVYPRDPDDLLLTIIEPDNLIGHVASYDRPVGTFGFPFTTKIVINSLNRNRP